MLNEIEIDNGDEIDATGPDLSLKDESEVAGESELNDGVAMSLEKGTRITTETERVLMIGKTRSRFEVWCSAPRWLGCCGRMRPQPCLPADFTASLETNKLRIIPTADGLMNVCLNSLLNQN